MNKLLPKAVSIDKKLNEYRIDTFLLILFNFFIIFLIANKEMEWIFHPFKNDEIAEKIGVQYGEPLLLSKFGMAFRCLTIALNLSGVLPVLLPKRAYRNFLVPVLVWNAYTITALLENLLQILITIINLQVTFKVIFSVLITGIFVIVLYLKLILQVIHFYDVLCLISFE